MRVASKQVERNMKIVPNYQIIFSNRECELRKLLDNKNCRLLVYLLTGTVFTQFIYESGNEFYRNISDHLKNVDFPFANREV